MRRIYSPNRQLDTPEVALAIIRQAEAFVPTWYLCPAQVWTIGYGTTENSIDGVNRSRIRQPIDRGQGELWLRYGVSSQYEPAVERSVRVPLTENEYGALVSLGYNIGGPALAGSTLVRLLNSGDREGAAEQFGRWVRADGKVWPGLVKRRAVERALFEDNSEDVIRIIEDLEPMPVLSVEAIAMPAPPTSVTLPALPADLRHLVGDSPERE